MRPGLSFPSVQRVVLCLGLLGPAAAVCLATDSAGAAASHAAEPAISEPGADQLKRSIDAEAAEAWLARAIPEGLMMAEAPEFFAAADEVFYNAEEDLFIYAYRSAATGRWIAWVAFDSDRARVAHTAAIELDR